MHEVIIDNQITTVSDSLIEAADIRWHRGYSRWLEQQQPEDEQDDEAEQPTSVDPRERFNTMEQVEKKL